MDKTLQCTTCGDSFLFSEEDQAFYASKGFQDPKKCKPCRDAAKAQRGGGGGRGGYGDRAPRQMYDTVCSSCNVQTQVPFQPNGSKPVYCRDCYQQQQGSYGYR